MNGPTSNLDSVIRAVTQLGFSVVVAGFLLWWTLTRFERVMEHITERMAQNTRIAEQLISENEKQLIELRAQTVELQHQTKSIDELASALAAKPR